jgi:hypothetical protein
MATGGFVLAPMRVLELIEDDLGFFPAAGLDELLKAIDRHGLFPLCS